MRAFNNLFFDGNTYDPERDGVRLTTQFDRVYGVMRDGKWHTLAEIVEKVSYPPYDRSSEAGVSARLRDFRKKKFLNAKVLRRRVKDVRGQWEYMLVMNKEVA